MQIDMSTTDLTSAQVNEKVTNLLDKKISPSSLAKVLRRINYTLALTAIRNNQDENPIDKDWLDDGYYWLNELAEILDPVLEKED